MTDEQEISGDEDYVGSHNMQYHGGRVIPEDEINNADEEYDDLYNDVNVGDGFKHMPMADALLPLAGGDNGGFKAPKPNVPEVRSEPKVTQDVSITGLARSSVGLAANKGSPIALHLTHNSQAGNMGYQTSVSVLQKVAVDSLDMPGRVQGELVPFQNSGPTRVVPQMGSNQISSSANASYNRPLVREIQVQPAVDNGNSMLFVGELHWWTTDADIENVLTQYGRVKEIKFFDERASGKSKGYCQVEFYESAAAAACKEGMNGHIFNGRACVVAFATPQSIKHMTSSYTNKTQVVAPPQAQGRRTGNETVGRGNGLNHPSGDTGRNLGRGGWGGRGGQGMPNKGPVGGLARGRGGSMVARNMFENTLGSGNGATGGGPYGQGFAGPNFGGPPAGLIHPQAMMAAPGFDPSYMGRGAGYGGFTGPAFPGMMSPFHTVNPMGLPGVAPHVNPAFFGRGMPSNVMGMMGTGGMEGPHAPMWTDSSVGGWEGEEHGRRTRESSYGGDDNASEYGYGEAGQIKGVRSSSGSREKEWGTERDRSGISDQGHHNERDPDREGHEGDYRYMEEKDSYRDNRQKERDSGYRDDLDRGQQSRSRATPEDYHRYRSNDAEYAKRRRPSE